jgi:regulation of enolase protein 1 (concanavalin A-like superfamily)
MGGMQSYVYLVKADTQGRKLWSKTFGQGDVNSGKSVQQTVDQGYILAGTTWSSDGTQSNIYVVKTDADGNEIWSRTYGGNRKDEGHSVRQTTDGGYIITGYTDSFGEGNEDVCLIKTDGDGDEIWSRTYGGNRKDEGHSVRQTTDSGYIIAGHTDSFGEGNDDVYLIKTDANGTSLWSRTFGGKGRDWGRSVLQTSDGGYIVAGTTWPFEERYSDVYMMKTDERGRKIWQKTFGGRYGDYGSSMQQTTDGGYIVVGNTWPFGTIGESKIYLVKTDGKGGKDWVKKIGGGGSVYGLSVCQTADGGYVVVGKTEHVGSEDDDIYLVKIRGDGTRVWSMTF